MDNCCGISVRYVLLCSYMKKCSFFNCNKEQYSRELCRTHVNHLYKYGEVRHTTNTPNEVIDCGDHLSLVMYKKMKDSGIRVLFDKDDYKKIKDLRFYISHGYAKVSNSKTQYLHRIICHCDAPLVCDHINQNKLDCRKKNLRCVTRAENMRNMDVSLYEHRWKRKPPISER